MRSSARYVSTLIGRALPGSYSLLPQTMSSCCYTAQVAKRDLEEDILESPKTNELQHACGKAVKEGCSAWLGKLEKPLDTPIKQTFYKRVLPSPPSIDFSSHEGVHIHAFLR